MLPIRIGFCALVLVPTSTIAFSQTTPPHTQLREYFVSPSGDDSAPGTKERPLKTIAKAASVAAKGDTILLAAGTYAERVAPANSGADGSPITIRAEANAVVWTAPEAAPARGSMGAALNLDGKGHWNVEGVTFKDCTCWITMGESHHVTVKDCVFAGSKIYNSMWVSNGSYIRVLNCDFQRARPYVTNEKGVSTNVTAADFIEFFRNSHHNLVEDCRFGEIGHVAILISAHREGFKPHHNIIRDCTFTDPRWKCLGIHGAEYTLVENSTMQGQAAVFFQFESPLSIVRRNQFLNFRSSLPDHEDIYRGAWRVGTTKDGNADCRWEHNRIYHNLFWGNDRAITSYAANGAIDDNIFKNNVFFLNRMTLWLCQPDYTTKNRTYFVNNFLCGTVPGEKLLGYGTKQFTLAEAQKEMPALYQGNIEAGAFGDGNAAGLGGVRGGPACRDDGADLTVTSEAGHGKVIPVEDPLYFCDGYGLIEGDKVVVGTSKPARIVKVDYQKKTIEIDAERTWKKGDGVNQPFSGKAPDIGPVEWK